MCKFYLTFLTSFIFCLMANASTHAEHSGEINWWGLGSVYADRPAVGWLFITFFIFIYILVKTLKKPLTLYFQTRSKDIKAQIEESKFLKEQNELKLKECQEKLQSLETEIENLKKTFGAQAQKEEHEIMQKALLTSERIKQDMQNMLNANFERTKQRLSKEIVLAAMKKSEEYIKQNSLDVDENLKKAFVDNIKTQVKVMAHEK